MAKQKQDEASKQEQRRKLEEDTRAFLKSGGEIQNIPTGLSGVDSTKPRTQHIKLGNK